MVRSECSNVGIEEHSMKRKKEELSCMATNNFPPMCAVLGQMGRLNDSAKSRVTGVSPVVATKEEREGRHSPDALVRLPKAWPNHQWHRLPNLVSTRTRPMLPQPPRSHDETLSQTRHLLEPKAPAQVQHAWQLFSSWWSSCLILVCCKSTG